MKTKILSSNEYADLCKKKGYMRSKLDAELELFAQSDAQCMEVVWTEHYVSAASAYGIWYRAIKRHARNMRVFVHENRVFIEKIQ